MNQGRLNRIAGKIIRENIYLTLATAHPSPWATPLYYCIDNDYTFYFISQFSSVHTQAILKNPRVAFAIFDSHQPEGTGNGVQGTGNASLIAPEDVPDALKWYHTSFIDVKPETFTADMPYRLFRLKASKMYILDPDAPTDKRVEVFLK